MLLYIVSDTVIHADLGRRVVALSKVTSGVQYVASSLGDIADGFDVFAKREFTKPGQNVKESTIRSSVWTEAADFLRQAIIVPESAMASTEFSEEKMNPDEERMARALWPLVRKVTADCADLNWTDVQPGSSQWLNVRDMARKALSTTDISSRVDE